MHRMLLVALPYTTLLVWFTMCVGTIVVTNQKVAALDRHSP